MRINIAIDGPSAAGKSTIAQILAKKLGYVHLDTGAMYRCTAYKALENAVSLDNEQALCDMLKNTNIELKPDGRVFLDGKDVSHVIREERVSRAASLVSTHPQVRADLVKRQQEMAAAKGFIMDGRDIGSVVLKDAEVKVFLTASAEARAKRRYDQDKANGIQAGSIEEIAEEIRKRDEQDMHRKASPLVKADDAVEVDTSNMTIEQAVHAIEELCQPYLVKEAEE